MKTFFSIIFGLTSAIQLNAAIIQFDLIGTAGNGLLAGNEPGVIVGGSGGEIGAGITFNDATLVLAINVGWGSGNGFSNLTSAVNNQHIHGTTANNYGNGFTQTAAVDINLTRTSSNPTNGTIVQNVTLTPTQMTNLFNGKYYINVHTLTNTGGEIRGFLVPVPQVSLSISNSQANFLLSGFAGQRQIIQVSSNLVNWSDVVTNSSGTNLFQFIEINPLQFPQRFYRARVIP